MAVSLLCAALTAAPVRAAGVSAWQAVGQIGGPTHGVAVQGSYAYVGVGLRLVILDISDPANLREVGVTPPFPHFVDDVAVSGSIAYVAVGTGGLRVVDVSNPALPTEIGAWESRGFAHGVATAGSIVYLADGPYGLRLLDVSNPAHPAEIGSAYVTLDALDVALEGRFAYVAAAGAGLLAVDVIDPTRPVELIALSTNGYAYGVAVDENRAYVADGWEGVTIVDVTDPARPAQAGAYKTQGWAFDVAVAGTRAYVADAFRGVCVLNVDDVAHPVELGRAEMPLGNAESVAVAGDTAFVTDRYRGLRAVKLSPESTLSEVDFYSTPSYVDSVAVAGDLAFVGTAEGLTVVDISNRTRPRQISALDLDGYATSVALQGQWLCAALFIGGLRIVDVSNPAAPRIVASYFEAPGVYRDMVVSDGIVYSANEWGLEIVTLADPQKPERLAFLDLPGDFATSAVVGVAVAGTMAFMASEGLGLHIVDVSDRRQPVLKGVWAVPVPQDVAVDGRYAYVAGGSGLCVADVADPTHPVGIGSVGLPGGQAFGVGTAGGVAYVADGDRGLFVIDVHDPVNPSVTAHVENVGFSHEAVPAGGLVFLADGPGGLLILEKTASGDSSIGVGAPETIPPVGPPYRGVHQPRISPVRARGAEASVKLAAPAPLATSDCIVTSSADSSAGSLRNCLEYATPGTKITFDTTVFPRSSPMTIALGATLPELTRGNVTIDASNAGVIVDGSSVHEQSAGLLHLASDGNVVRGLQVLRGAGGIAGIAITGSRNVIGGNRLLGQGNVISGHNGDGIHINAGFGAGTASENIVTGNLIGTDASGAGASGNSGCGIHITGGASRNRIGGLTPGEGNVVSASRFGGISIGGPTANGNLILGNYVGTDITGTVAVGNSTGISVDCGSFGNLVQGNLASGNTPGYGIVISDWGSSYNTVIGNLVGTDVNGSRAIPNTIGIGIYRSASHNRIGGPRPVERNVISGNETQGITVSGPAANGNLIRGNFIGTDVTGTHPLANLEGVSLGADSRTTLGGATPSEGNVISAALMSGALNVFSDGNFIARNLLGTDVNGVTAIGNRRWGARVDASRNILQTNVIAHSEGDGIFVPADDAILRRNSIHSNSGAAISKSSAQGDTTAPVITIVSAATVSGTACPGCEVEIFSDSEDEGRIFEGSVVANASGAFTLILRRRLAGPYLTATATTPEGSTSVLSAPHATAPRAPRRRHQSGRR